MTYLAGAWATSVLGMIVPTSPSPGVGGEVPNHTAQAPLPFSRPSPVGEGGTFSGHTPPLPPPPPHLCNLHVLLFVSSLLSACGLWALGQGLPSARR